MAIVGFIVLAVVNGWFTVGALFNLLYGGEEFGPLLPSSVHWKYKVIGLAIAAANLFFWYLLFINSPLIY